MKLGQEEASGDKTHFLLIDEGRIPDMYLYSRLYKDPVAGEGAIKLFELCPWEKSFAGVGCGEQGQLTGLLPTAQSGFQHVGRKMRDSNASGCRDGSRGRAHSVPAEDLSSAPSTHFEQLKTAC